MHDVSPPLTIAIIAGEASGDALGAALMQSLQRQSARPLRFIGIGGPLMCQSGLNSLFPFHELSLMGIAEILPRLGHLLKRIRQTADYVREVNPDIVVTIDSPDFSFRVMRRLRKTGYKGGAVHYVAPTVWAWRPGRARKLAKLYDAVLCLFPFEPPYFEREGMKASFVGHSMMDSGLTSADGAAYRRDYGIAENVPVIGLLPGSRTGEVARTGPDLVQALRLYLENASSDLIPVIIIPTLPHIEHCVRALCRDLPARIIVETDPLRKSASFRACNAALAVSGTVGLELAVAGVPHLIGYRMTRLTWFMIRRLVKVRYAHLANLLLDRAAIPEFIQDECRPDRMAAALTQILADPSTQHSAFADVRALLRSADHKKPADEAAGFILGLSIR